MQTVLRENHFFENVALLVFEALDGPLGLILLPLWLIWSENGSQNGPKSGPKSDQKVVQKSEPKNDQQVSNL